jgi:DNA repair protein RecN (Recombination protein N)
MLTELSIRDYALIETLRLELGPGLTVLTGETGAGKSIVVGALSLLLGGRADSDMVRTGADSALVEARFELNEEMAEQCRALGIEPGSAAEPVLILRRRVERNGRGTCHANDSGLTLAALERLGDRLVDLHGQHQHQFLLRPDVHLDILDDYAGLTQERAEFSERFHACEQTRTELARLEQELATKSARRDLTEFQARELTDAAVEPGEAAALQRERELLESAERRHTLVHETRQLLSEGEVTACGLVGAAEKALAELSRIDDRLAERRSVLAEARVLLDELWRELVRYGETIDFSAERLDAVNARLFLIERLERKYGVSADELPTLARRLQAELGDAAADNDRRDALAARLASLQAELVARARRLSRQRNRSRARLEQQLHQELAAVGLGRAELVIDIRFPSDAELAAVLTERGGDTAEFLFTANPGEERRPLRKVASGGELSRIMLALKGVLAHADPVPTLVFDEIDSGIGGRVAETVGQRLARLGRTHQVICITHLPQIAKYAARHLLVEKSTRGARTRTQVRELDAESRVLELARMAGGATVTRAALAHAREMLKSADLEHS